TARTVVREIALHSFLVLFQKIRASDLENHGRRTEGVAASKQWPQVALATFNCKEWDNEHAAVDTLFADSGCHIWEIDFDDLYIPLRIKALLFEDDTEDEVDGRTIGVDAHLLALEILHRLDRGILQYEKCISRVASMTILIIIRDDR